MPDDIKADAGGNKELPCFLIQPGEIKDIKEQGGEIGDVQQFAGDPHRIMDAEPAVERDENVVEIVDRCIRGEDAGRLIERVHRGEDKVYFPKPVPAFHMPYYAKKISQKQ